MAELIYALEKSPKTIELIGSIGTGVVVIILSAIIFWFFAGIIKAATK
jgi:hypothetical protein